MEELWNRDVLEGKKSCNNIIIRSQLVLTSMTIAAVQSRNSNNIMEAAISSSSLEQRASIKFTWEEELSNISGHSKSQKVVAAAL